MWMQLMRRESFLAPSFSRITKSIEALIFDRNIGKPQPASATETSFRIKMKTCSEDKALERVEGSLRDGKSIIYILT